MKKNYFNFKMGSVFLLALLSWSTKMTSQTIVNTFSYTGSVQNFTIPPCVTQLTLEVWGAEGGGSVLSQNTASGFGGLGGYARGTLTVAPNGTLSVYVGGFGQSSNSGPAAGGFNGGGSGYASSSGEPGNGGGGGTDIRLNGVALTDRVIVAGGGGGGGEDAGDSYGHGGGTTGVGYSPYDGTQTTAGQYGGLGFGATTNFGDGGGGGGGYYGGGKSYTSTTIGDDTQGGGGGSGYVGTLTATSLIDGTSSMPNPSGGTTNGRSGNGFARITYSVNGTAATITPTSVAICNGNSTILSGSGVVTYTWLPVGPFTGSNTANIGVNPSATTVYTLTGTNSLGCISQKQVTVNVSTSAPVLGLTQSTNNVCLGQTVTLTATGALTYTWTGGVINGQSYTPTATSNYTVQGQNGCGVTQTVTSITVAPLPVSVLATPTLVCEGYPSTLTAVSSATLFTWSSQQTVNSQTAIVAPMANTVYTVTVTNGICAGMATLAVTTKQTPTVTASTSNSVLCEGQSTNLTASGALNYVWTPGGTSASFTVAPSVSTSYALAGTNSVGCTAYATQVILVNPGPTITVAQSNNAVCANSPVTFTANGSNTYTWTSGPQTAVYTVTLTGPATFTVSGTHANGCVGSKTVAVSVVVPNVSVSSPSAVCVGGTVALTATGATTYSWNTVLGGPVKVVQPTVTTTYTLTTNTSSLSLNCKATTTVQVIVNPNPTVTAVPTKTLICRAQSNTLTASGAVNYNWGAAGSGASVVVSPTTTSFYTVTATDANSCSSFTIIQVIVNTCSGFAEGGNINQDISIYPNPSNGEFFVKAGSDITLHLVNNLGQELKTFNLDAGNKYEVAVRDLPAGVYFVVGENKDGKVNQKIVVSK